jgi:hypothetical protein
MDGDYWVICLDCPYRRKFSNAPVTASVKQVNHRTKRNHSVKLVLPDGNSDTLERVTMDRSGKPPF